LWRSLGDRNLLEFLVGRDLPSVQVVEAQDAPQPDERDTLLFLPADRLRPPLGYFAPGTVVSAHPGGWTWNIAGDTASSPLYWAYAGVRPTFDTTTPPLGCWFDGWLCLMAYWIDNGDGGGGVQLVWRGQPAPGLDPYLEIGDGSAERQPLGGEGLPFEMWRPDMFVLTEVELPATSSDSHSAGSLVIRLFASASAAVPAAPDHGAGPVVLELPGR
jgi:hypothetical protein